MPSLLSELDSRSLALCGLQDVTHTKAVRACAKGVSQKINKGLFSSPTSCKKSSNEDLDKLLEVQSRSITIKYHPLMTNGGMLGVILLLI